jgi:hypothetical protein
MSKVKLNINSNDASNDDLLYVWDVIDKKPSRAVLHNNIDEQVMFKLLSDNFSERECVSTITDIIPVSDDVIENIKYFDFLCDGVWISYISIDGYENRFISDINIIYDLDQIEKVNVLISEICKHSTPTGGDSINRENILCVKDGALDTEPMNHPDNFEFMEMFYNKKTYTKIKRVAKIIENNERGICILHGERGSGKTNCMRYISSKLKDVTIFIPSNLLDLSINNPEFRNILTKYPKVILFIDDCEFLINSQFTKLNSFTTNLLQLTDGFVDNNIHIILSFNDRIDKMDNDILNSNNLNSLIEFHKLSIDEATDLTKHLDLKTEIKTEMLLRDVVRGNKIKSKKLGL